MLETNQYFPYSVDDTEFPVVPNPIASLLLIIYSQLLHPFVIHTKSLHGLTEKIKLPILKEDAYRKGPYK